MGKTKSSFINMVVTLFVVTGVASLALAGVYKLTKEPIAMVQKQKQENAIKQVVPEFDEIKENTITLSTGEQLVCFDAFNGDEKVGTAVKTFTNKGYSGLVELMVGFLPDGSIKNVEVLKQTETPGLGTKMTQQAFKGQFDGKNPLQFRIRVKKDGGDVDAITAATISSRAFCDAAERAYEAYKAEGGNQ